MTPATASPRRYVQRVRAEAAESTARRIADAFLALLMDEWFDEITLDRIAAKAGVTVQTVVRRFGGKDGLLADSVQTLATQINTRRASPPGDVGRMVENLLADYEETGDAIVRLLALEPRHAALKAALGFGRSEHRRWVSDVFAEPLETLDAAARRRALDALVVATDVYTWKLLRRDMGHSVGATAATLVRLVHATLAEFADSDHTRKERR